jgi:hypothetical protein
VWISLRPPRLGPKDLHRRNCSLAAASVWSLETYVETLLYQVRATDWRVLAVPALTVGIAALAAALPAVIHAIRIDPARMLRLE